MTSQATPTGTVVTSAPRMYSGTVSSPTWSGPPIASSTPFCIGQDNPRQGHESHARSGPAVQAPRFDYDHNRWRRPNVHIDRQSNRLCPMGYYGFPQNNIEYTEENRAYVHRPSDWAIHLIQGARFAITAAGHPTIFTHGIIHAYEALEAYNIAIHHSIHTWEQMMLHQDASSYYYSQNSFVDNRFPGLNARRTLGRTLDRHRQRFRSQFISPASPLFRRIMTVYMLPLPLRRSFQPNFSLEELVTLALLSRSDRTADILEMTTWITESYPWFHERQLYMEDSAWGPGLLHHHLDAFFQNLNACYDSPFTPVNPTSRNRGPVYAMNNAHHVWYLPPGNENHIFRVLYDPAYDVVPIAPLLSTRRFALLKVPRDIMQVIMRYLLTFKGDIYVAWQHLRPGYFVAHPPWMPTPWTLPDQAGNLIGANTKTTPRPGQWITIPEGLFEIPQLRELALHSFFRLNSFVVLPDSGSFAEPAPFLARTWLSQTGIAVHGQGYLRRVTMHIDFHSYQRQRLAGVLEILGQVLNPEITLIMNSRKLKAHETADPVQIPGMQVIRRFRGCDRILIVVDPPLPALNVIVQSWVTRPHLRRNPDQAFLPKPKAVSTLKRQHGLAELTDLAIQYGYDLSHYISLPDGGNPMDRTHLATFIAAEQDHEYYDSDEVRSRILPRSRPTNALRAHNNGLPPNSRIAGTSSGTTTISHHVVGSQSLSD